MYITLHLPTKHIGLPELSLLPLCVLFFSALTLIFSSHASLLLFQLRPQCCAVLRSAAQPAFPHRLSPLLWERPSEVLKQYTEVSLGYQLNTGAGTPQEFCPWVLRQPEDLMLLYSLVVPTLRDFNFTLSVS